jgi:hypothetical protein
MAAPAPSGGGAPGSGGSGGAAGGAAPASAAPSPNSGGTGSTNAAPAAAPAATPTTSPAAFVTGVYNGASVALTPIPSSQVLGVVPAGTLTNFQTNESAYSCLNGVSLNVYDNVNGKAVAEAVTPNDCVAQDFQLP